MSETIIVLCKHVAEQDELIGQLRAAIDEQEREIERLRGLLGGREEPGG